MIDGYTPEVGDIVMITKSSENWVSSMDQYDGIQCTIKEAIAYTYHQKSCKKVIFELGEYPGLREWTWIYECGHFTPVKVSKKKRLKLKLWKTIDQKLEI